MNSAGDGTPSPPRSVSVQSESKKPVVTVYALQVRVFLEASDEVDVDDETLADILDGFKEELGDEIIGGVDEELDGSVDDDLDAEAVDISGLDEYEDEAAKSWTKQEIRHMKHQLKERGMAAWLQEYVETRNVPIPKLLYAFGICLCKELRAKRTNTLLYFLKVALSRELRLREKLIKYNTVADAVDLIRSAQRILILTGAGISVSCGIPDFRSRNGLYATLKERGKYDLDDPQQMFDIQYFKENPSVFYSFASQIYPSNFIPSPCHRFIKLIEDKNKLLRNYTQNIDTLETRAGVHRVLQCHGSFATATCLNCRRCVPGIDIEADVLQQSVPLCSVCNVPPAVRATKKNKKKGGKRKRKGRWDSEEEEEDPAYPPGIMKPDITFFGEKLTDEFDRAVLKDREEVDLLLIIGTSLAVAPVADMLLHLPHSVPQILINKTPIRHINPDIVLLGNADNIVHHLCQELGWDLPPAPALASGAHLEPPQNLRKRSSAETFEPRRVTDSHVWLFDGAEGGRWVKEMEERGLQVSNDELQSNGSGTQLRPEGVRKTKKSRVE